MTYSVVVVILLKMFSNSLVVIIAVDNLEILQVKLIVLRSILSIIGAHYYFKFKLIILLKLMEPSLKPQATSLSIEPETS